MAQIKWRAFVIHHSATEDDGNTLSWPALRHYHIAEKGWKDTAYHFGVELYRDDFEVLVGRPLTMEGAHCQGGVNEWGIGVCVVGSYSDVYPPVEMIEVLCKRLIVPLGTILEIPLDDKGILFHRDLWATECPGRLFGKEWFFKVLEECKVH